MKHTYLTPQIKISHKMICGQIIAASSVKIDSDDNNAIDAANSLTKENNNDEIKPWYRQ